MLRSSASDSELVAPPELTGRGVISDGYFSVGGKRFSHVPKKHTSTVALPAVRRMAGNLSLNELAMARSASSGLLRRCCGDYCGVTIQYPSSLQDLESSKDPWMAQARELCQRTGAMGKPMFTAEEMVACLGSGEEASGAPSKSSSASRMYSRMSSTAPSRLHSSTPALRSGTSTSPLEGPTLGSETVSTAWVLEARSHPELCELLAQRNWMFNPKEPEVLIELGRAFWNDENAEASVPMRGIEENKCQAGLRHRLKPISVCKDCLRIYTVINTAVELIRDRRKDIWAKKELRRRKAVQERDKDRELEAYFARDRPGGAVRFEPKVIKQKFTQSYIMSPDDVQWLRDLDSSPVLSDDASDASLSRSGGSSVARRARRRKMTPKVQRHLDKALRMAA